MLTCHAGETYALTWSFEKKRLGSHCFWSKDRSQVKCVHASHCGNYGLLGTLSGSIDVFNMQSGLHKFSIRNAHGKGGVSSVLLLNIGTVIVSCGLDGYVKYWSFFKRTLIHSEKIAVPIVKTAFFLENDLLAVASEDFNVRVYDMDTKCLIRHLADPSSGAAGENAFDGAHSQAITSLSFSNDGKWLVSASVDRTIKTWDITTGLLLDTLTMKEDTPAAASLSPSGHVLATISADSRSIQLWINRSFYGLPTKTNEDRHFQETGENSHQWPLSQEDEKDSCSIVLSSSSSLGWQRLLNYTLIKEKNKPHSPPKKPEPAPFFLDKIGDKVKKNEEKADVPSKIRTGIHLDNDSPHLPSSQLEELLLDIKVMDAEDRAQDTDDANFSIIRDVDHYLSKSSPGGPDFDIKMLTGVRSIEAFLFYLHAKFSTKKDFDMAHSFLNIFLKASTPKIAICTLV